ncbi:hypothetical protein ALC57_10861 [Trachymyrmex cornetzi]|uniref:Uncharacterized protein n=1 Tax=Trachymyrmex cornetzi TaxID=471704 RepID=A0A195DVW2_9HYME|nr:hypothetical protein ALC57_10861 [Trachymyrmex cornetzi]
MPTSPQRRLRSVTHPFIPYLVAGVRVPEQAGNLVTAAHAPGSDDCGGERRSETKTSDSQETKDNTRQIKRDASRQEVGGEVGPTGRIALWGGFRAWIPSLYGRGNGYSTIACNPISTDAIYPIYHTLLSGALSTPAGGRSIA